MSKIVSAQIQCPHCGHQFETKLYRTIWLEDPKNRKRIFDDEINTVTCPACKERTRLKFAFLCTNAKKGIAVWYEPYHDPAIDKDIQQYRTQMGADSFYARAPRIQDWETFKAKILELEKQAGSNKPNVAISSEMQENIHGFIDTLGGQQKNLQRRYPIWLTHLKKGSNRLKYSFVPFVFLVFLDVLENGLSSSFEGMASDIGQVLVACVALTAVTYALLSLVHIAILEAKPWRERSKAFRLWCFVSAYWILGVFAYMLYGGIANDDELIYLFLISFLPPLLIGSAKYFYDKYIA